MKRSVLLPAFLVLLLGLASLGACGRPRWPLRGHQATVALHPSMFRTWPELVTFVGELRAFGTNQIEIAHLADPIDTGKNEEKKQSPQ
jgi:hypothetical protein